ncbi:hypothetical protein Srubr_18760 [Streptomyces rubradiris]|uniref:Uncharacterized protein n=1 Tax=Streptomyces rubradiris TaxID=285531 RepID=A0ABQ3R847_STRRR|nr:hypothetical protein Srubr_18760 [Streptomyces rubradiris]
MVPDAVSLHERMRDSVRAELIRALPLVLREHADTSVEGRLRDAERAVTYPDLEARTRRLAGHLADSVCGAAIR